MSDQKGIPLPYINRFSTRNVMRRISTRTYSLTLRLNSHRWNYKKWKQTVCKNLFLDLESEREHIQPRSQSFSSFTHALRGTGRREILGSRLEHVLASSGRDTKSPSPRELVSMPWNSKLTSNKTFSQRFIVIFSSWLLLSLRQVADEEKMDSLSLEVP